MGKAKDHIPIRTCISCGSKRTKSELIRLVLDREGQLKRDHEGTRPGRGAYVCKSESCQEQIMKNKRLVRAFRGHKPKRISEE